MPKTLTSDPSISEIRRHVRVRIGLACAAAEDMQLSAKNASLRESRAEPSEIIHEIDVFRELPLGFGRKLFACIIFVDLRDSSKRAFTVGERETYLTMHALLHGLSFVVKQFGGIIVGFRGDGLFAAFGMNERGETVPPNELGSAVRDAVRCGKAMIEAVDHAVEPELAEFGVTGNLRIGVGIDANNLVVTNIGLFTANEITAYGNPVNKSAKLADVTYGKVMITNGAWKLVPKSKDGRWSAKAYLHEKDALHVHFPSDYSVLT
ncbi:MAG: adenylate/guanylate cyclase domain-containing protein [Planctomycetota bacterium]|nr:MAG: adenylate/guanylate cyclase domain-containing protein [Planctomycetota bacterium]